MSHSNLKRNQRQTQHAYCLVNTMLPAFQLKSPITAVLWPSWRKFRGQADALLC